MWNGTRSSRVRLEHRLTISFVAVTLLAVLIAEGLALFAAATIVGRPIFGGLDGGFGWTLNVAVTAIGAGVVALLLGARVSRSLAYRVQRILEIVRAWLRGSLSLRIADLTSDDLGLLGEQLDLLAAHLERDEQDLNELWESNARLTDQVRALAVDEERERLARELHDSVKQHLFSLAMTASAIRAHLEADQNASPDVVEMVHEAETTAQTVQRELTRLIQDLRPSSLQEKGLATALNDYTLLFGAREHILVYLEAQGNDALLIAPLAETLYRVAQEALHNVARHARATRVDVHLSCAPEQVTLTVRDNGVGFDTGRAHRGLGLTNMQERMMAVSGRLTIESRPGNGTTVLAEAGLTQPLSAQTGIARLDRERPSPTIENWAWLGQRLVIPVGQTWPWLPADQVHLRRPLIESAKELLAIERDTGLLSLKQNYLFRQGQQPTSLLRVHHSRSGYEWKSEGAQWALRYIRGPNNRMVLVRNGQSVAAMQQQGRLLNTWSEIIYDGRGYRLSCGRDRQGGCVLVDESGDTLLTVEGADSPRIKLRRALPLPLTVIAAMRIVDEMASTKAAAKAVVENVP